MRQAKLAAAEESSARLASQVEAMTRQVEALKAPVAMPAVAEGGSIGENELRQAVATERAKAAESLAEMAAGLVSL